MIPQGYQVYRQVKLETSTGPQLLLALYDGAIRYLGLAQQAIEAHDVQTAHTNLVRTQDVIFELINTLNMDYGEIPERLKALYLYLYRRLTDANVTKSADPMREVDQILRQLRDAWRQAVTEVSAHAGAGAGGPAAAAQA